jgi:acetaldehyde dehydrogenase
VSKIKIAVLGSGNIGSDLAERLLIDNEFEVVALVGRNKNSKGLERFVGRVPLILSDGINGFKQYVSQIDGIFDATSAQSAAENWKMAHENNKWLIDLTPSKIGTPFVPIIAGIVPGIDLSEDYSHNYSMITCGGQASAPIINALTLQMKKINNIEVSSSIAAKSAGIATRLNMDQYVNTTEELISSITRCMDSKVILILNPSSPEVPMRTTITVNGTGTKLSTVARAVDVTIQTMKDFVPGYDLIGKVIELDPETYSVTIRVSGAGYFLPSFAGNLDIINAAAVATARMHAKKHLASLEL